MAEKPQTTEIAENVQGLLRRVAFLVSKQEEMDTGKRCYYNVAEAFVFSKVYPMLEAESAKTERSIFELINEWIVAKCAKALAKYPAQINLTAVADLEKRFGV